MKTITGKDIFFNFIEFDFNDNKQSSNFLEQLYNNELDGFVCRGVLSPEEVATTIQIANNIEEEEFLKTSNGKMFPFPYATISNTEDKLEQYIIKNKKFNSLPLDFLTERVNDFFKKYCGDFEVKTPKVLKTGEQGSYANFRYFMPNMGGLFVHCGYFFQQEHALYFDVMEEMDKHGQLSFFMALQYPETGGELSVFDMLWPEYNAKESFEENNFVLKSDGTKVNLKDIRKFTVKPAPGDILVFRGGPIWHRVEQIFGNIPRISFGGFINFSKDGKSLYYWG